MKIIIFEDEIYKVSEKEFKTLKKLAQSIKDSANYKDCLDAEDALHDYLDANKHKYRFIGVVDFHTQRSLNN